MYSVTSKDVIRQSYHFNKLLPLIRHCGFFILCHSNDNVFQRKIVLVNFGHSNCIDQGFFIIWVFQYWGIRMILVAIGMIRFFGISISYITNF